MSKLHKNLQLVSSIRARACLLNLNCVLSANVKLQKNISKDYHAFIKGLSLYQTHTYQRNPENHSVVWHDGETRVVWYAAKTNNNAATKGRILIVPSLINGTDIFDLLPERGPHFSLIRWLNNHGYEVLLLQWGYICADPILHTLDGVIATKLRGLLGWLQQNVKTPSSQGESLPLYGFGYCMGGTIMAAAASFYPDLFDRLVFIATPWDFGTEAQRRHSTPKVEHMLLPHAIREWANAGGMQRLQHTSQMPQEWLHMIFAQLDPSQVAQKFSRFAHISQRTLKARLFVAIEDWINGGQDIPATLISDIIDRWYINNLPHRGKWRIAGELVNLQEISAPTLMIIPHKDRIVPPAHSRALMQHFSNPFYIDAPCGHIAMMNMASSLDIWRPVIKWLKG